MPSCALAIDHERASRLPRYESIQFLLESRNQLLRFIFKSLLRISRVGNGVRAIRFLCQPLWGVFIVSSLPGLPAWARLFAPSALNLVPLCRPLRPCGLAVKRLLVAKSRASVLQTQPRALCHTVLFKPPDYLTTKGHKGTQRSKPTIPS